MNVLDLFTTSCIFVHYSIAIDRRMIKDKAVICDHEATTMLSAEQLVGQRCVHM